MFTIIVAFDPGLKGGISIFKDGELVVVEEMPLIQRDKKKVYDLDKIIEILSPYKYDKTLSVIEKQSSRPGEGSVSSFTNGSGYGALKGVSKALGFETKVLRPKVWKTYFTQLENDEVVALRESQKAFREKSKKEILDLESTIDKSNKRAVNASIKKLKKDHKKEIERLGRQLKQAGKKASLGLAREKYPNFKDSISKAGDDGLAESMLIGTFAVLNIEEIDNLTDNYYY